MKEVEFYSYDDEVWYKDTDGNTQKLTIHSRDIVDTMYETIKNEYPDAFSEMSEVYQNKEKNIINYKYVVVKRFIKCNFSKVDTTYIDIESLGGKERMNFEKVDCPLRGECPHEDKICLPRFSSKLTSREMEVAEYWYEGKTMNEISEQMFLSYDTINNHIRRINNKLGVHSKSEFMKYVDAKRLFDK